MNASWTNTLLIAGTTFLVNTIYVVWDVWRSRVEQGKAIDGMIKRKVELLDKSREVNATQAALIISLQDEAKEKQQEISKLEEYVETYKAIPMILRALGDREIDPSMNRVELATYNGAPRRDEPLDIRKFNLKVESAIVCENDQKEQHLRTVTYNGVFVRTVSDEGNEAVLRLLHGRNYVPPTKARSK